MKINRLLTTTVLTLVFFFCSVSTSSAQLDRFEKSYDVSQDKVFRVDINIDAGEVEFRKSRNDEAKVWIEYTEGEFDIYDDFDRSRSRLEIEFDKRGWVGDNDDLDAYVVIELPADVETDLEARIKAGEIDIDLGGMTLVRLELTTFAGEVTVMFSEANKTAMEFLKINTKIGETDIDRLGNARFKEAEINGGIGEMSIDFRGNLLRESIADIDLDIGETRVRLPEEAGVRLRVSKFIFASDIDLPHGYRKSGKYYYSENYDTASSTLELRVSSGIGELQIY